MDLRHVAFGVPHQIVDAARGSRGANIDVVVAQDHLGVARSDVTAGRDAEVRAAGEDAAVRVDG